MHLHINNQRNISLIRTYDLEGLQPYFALRTLSSAMDPEVAPL